MAARRLSQTGALVLAAMVLVVLALVVREASAQLCPLCECPATYRPVCGKTTDKQGKVKLRGFASRCVMECNNQCRKAQFEFVKRGRCGPKVPKHPNRDPAENSVLDKGSAVANATAPSPKVTVPAEK